MSAGRRGEQYWTGDNSRSGYPWGQWQPPFVSALASRSAATPLTSYMLFMNDQALQRLLSDRFKTVADATAVAGLDGRHVAVGTDIKLSALV
jgi:hypothetical protein